MKIKIGRIGNRLTSLPKFMVSTHWRREPHLRTFWLLGRLYVGYVGVFTYAYRLHIDVWIYHMEVRSHG